ncbi:secreted RxLR effector protein 161-like [Anopheles arabiensis]|uniref:secreted RxLR effector protein 161-like n=1 Tax=Anopheles arabiensis TaxID=7173 RepID=UPI001AAC6611|nr:secreted RxLR effector protein 161-like [Anopheles arabiensis]
MDQGFLKDTADTKLLEDNTKYRSVVGAILYIAVCARPDIMATATVLGRKVSAPTEKDWTAAKRAVRYLKDTKDWKLKMGGEHGVTDCGDLIAFSDADWAGDSSSRKSTTGYVVYFSGGAVSWASRKQSNVTLSTMEAEYVALVETCQEVLWCVW